MTGLIRIYLPSSLGNNSLQSAIDLLIQPVEPSAGSKMPAFTFRPVPKSSIPSMDAPHVLMDYVSLRKLVTMRKEMLLSNHAHNAHCERQSAAAEPPLETAETHSPTLSPELDLGLDAGGQELVWMMEFAGSESGDSAVMSGCGCTESMHGGDMQGGDDQFAPKIVEVVEEEVALMSVGEPAPTHLHRKTTVFESLTELDALPPLPDSPASSIYAHEPQHHVPTSLPDLESVVAALDTEPTAPTQLNQPHPPTELAPRTSNATLASHPPTELAPRTSNATLASSPILKDTDLTPVASPTMDAIEHHERPESPPISPGDEALAMGTPTAEFAPVLASHAVSVAQADHAIVESPLPATATAAEAAPMMPRTISEPISPAPATFVAVSPRMSRIASDSAMSVSLSSPAFAGGNASTIPLRESVDLGSSTMRTTQSSKSSLFKRFSQSFSTLTRTGKHDKQRDEVVVLPTRTAPAGSLSMSRSVDLLRSPAADAGAPAIAQSARAEEELPRVVKKKKSKLFSSLFGGKGHDHNEVKAAKKERKAQEKAEKAARNEAKRVAKALTS